jgi:signal transduction histidine kinase
LDNKKDLYVFIDKLRTQQILINLIQNSIKFSKKGDSIDLKVNFFDVENSFSNIGVSFTVRDYGIGISDDDRTQLF